MPHRGPRGHRHCGDKLKLWPSSAWEESRPDVRTWGPQAALTFFTLGLWAGSHILHGSRVCKIRNCHISGSEEPFMALSEKKENYSLGTWGRLEINLLTAPKHWAGFTLKQSDLAHSFAPDVEHSDLILPLAPEVGRDPLVTPIFCSAWHCGSRPMWLGSTGSPLSPQGSAMPPKLPISPLPSPSSAQWSTLALCLAPACSSYTDGMRQRFGGRHHGASQVSPSACRPGRLWLLAARHQGLQ